MKTTPLIYALDAVIESLEKGTVRYNPKLLNSDNVGILAQAILGITSTSLSMEYLDRMVNLMPDLDKRFTAETIRTFTPNWQSLIYCFSSMTGYDKVKLFHLLEEAGLSRTNISELEYLNNPYILKQANISTDDVIVWDWKYVMQGFLWWKKTVKIEYQQTVLYHSSSQNYYQYLIAWREMLLKKQPTGKYNIIKEKSLFYDDEEYHFRTVEDLETLKDNFISRQQYGAIKFVDQEIEKLRTKK